MANTMDLYGDDGLMDALITRIFPQTFDGTFIDDKVTKLGMYALYYQSEIKQIRLPMVKELSNYALAHSGVTSLNDESLPICTVISNYAFQYCQSLKSVALTAVTSLGGNAFQNCPLLESISLPNYAGAVNSYTFADCTALKEIDLPKVTSAMGSSFTKCHALRKVTLPSATKLIAAFMSCNSLEVINLPAIVNLGTNQVSQSRKMREINLGPNLTTIDKTAFNQAPSGMIVNMAISEGAIEGAPWGGTDIIINYDVPYHEGTVEEEETT